MLSRNPRDNQSKMKKKRKVRCSRTNREGEGKQAAVIWTTSGTFYACGSGEFCVEQKDRFAQLDSGLKYTSEDFRRRKVKACLQFGNVD